MNAVNIFEAKAKLTELLDRAARGERIVICRHNKPVAELRALEGRRTEPRPVGPLPGRPQIKVPESFFEPLPDDVLVAWEGVEDGGADVSDRSRSAARGVRAAESKSRYAAPRPRRGRGRS